MYLYPIMRGTVLTTSVFLTLLLWGIHPAVAQIQTQNVTVNASLNVNTALTLTQETPLYFGAFQAGKGSGTITLTASETPQLSYTGYVTVLSTHGLSAGKFRVSGNPNAQVNVICATWSHDLTGPEASMNIHYVKSAETITLNSSGIGYIYIGANVSTWYEHPAGTYSGTFDLTVVYN